MPPSRHTRTSSTLSIFFLNEHYDTPPENSWSTAKGEGIDPPPMVINADHAPNSDEDQGDGGGRWNNDADNTMVK